MNLLSSFKRVNAGKVDGWLDTLFDASWADIWKLAANWHEAPGKCVLCFFSLLQVDLKEGMSLLNKTSLLIYLYIVI